MEADRSVSENYANLMMQIAFLGESRQYVLINIQISLVLRRSGISFKISLTNFICCFIHFDRIIFS